MTLQSEIKKMQEEMLPMIPKDVLSLLLSKTKELEESGLTEKALKKGDKIPNIVLPNATKKEIEIE